MTFEEKTIDSEYVYKGRLINVRRDRVITVSGRESYREIVEHCDAVTIAAIKDNGNMLMERQYRKALDRDVFEVPAGKIDEGEEPEAACLRELREETGFRAGKVRLLTTTYPSVGYATEKLYVYLCTDLTPGDTDFDDSEAIDLEEYPVEELYEMVISGKINDAKSQVTIMLAADLARKGEL